MSRTNRTTWEGFRLYLGLISFLLRGEELHCCIHVYPINQSINQLNAVTVVVVVDSSYIYPRRGAAAFTGSFGSFWLRFGGRVRGIPRYRGRVT